jgi:cell division protein YceG involved in septum cleavage
MVNKNLIIIGLAAMVVALVVAFLFVNGVVKLPEGSKYKSSEEVSGATVDIGSGVEKVGSTLEEIDRSLG